jgi:adenylate kinase
MASARSLAASVAGVAGRGRRPLTDTSANFEPLEANGTGSGNGFIPGPVLLIGPPGVGKGTQAKLLMAEFRVPQISTGDLLRDHRTRRTELGLAASELIDKGILVPDDLVNEMVAARLALPDCSRGYILDGFPRTLPQASWLDAYLAKSDPSYPVVVLSLVAERNDLLQRITGRRICPQGHIYNIYSQPPKVDGICDIDGSELQQRKDDTVAVFEERMKVFEEETAPVILHYQSKGRSAQVDGLQDVASVTHAIRARLQELRASSRSKGV